MGQQSFSTAGLTSFQVPVDITSITVKCWAGGAGGGAGGTSGVGGVGGGGGYVQGDITVTPSEILSIHLGGAGNSGSFGGTSGSGGGGAGLSSVSRGSTPLFVAGAGGGGGGGDNSNPAAGGAGGAGGSSTGGTGGSSLNANGGTGGSQVSGGTGGTGGIVSGAAGGAPISAAANFGNCLDFDGTDEWVSSANSYSNPQTFTTELWFKTTTTSGGLLIGFGNSQTGTSTSYDRRIWLSNSGNVYCGVYAGLILGVQTVNSSGTYNDGEWHHVAMVHDSGGFELFVDGISQGTNANPSQDTFTGYWRLAGTTVWSGWSPAPTNNYYVGQIDEVRFWQEARTTCQLINNANKYLAGTETNLAFYWKLNESSGSTANDETTNNNDGTLQNMEDADWVTSSWSGKWIGIGTGGDGGDGNDGGTTRGSEANGGITCAGSGGTADVGAAGYGGGGGGGAGYGGGGGGSASQASNAGGGGGGGGSSYIIGSATSTTNTQASGQNPPNTSDPDYTGSAGVGGNGGATSTAGSNGNNGLIVISWTEPPTYVGITFVASSSQRLASVANFTPPQNCSVSWWLKLSSLNQFGRTASLSVNWEIGLSDNAGTPTANGIINAMNSGALLYSSTSLQADLRYHVVCTATSSARQIFLNGVLDNSAASGGTAPAAGTLYVGCQYGGTLYFLDGAIEDLRVYNRIITAEEVATIYACEGRDGITYGLIHRWPMNEGAAGVVASGTGSVKDEATNQLNLTATNSPVYSGSQLNYRRKYRTH